MLWKISNGKVDHKIEGPLSNDLTFMKCQNMPFQARDDKEKQKIKDSGWLLTVSQLCLALLALVGLAFLGLTLHMIYTSKTLSRHAPGQRVYVQRCHYKHLTGKCINFTDSCDGEAIIGNDIHLCSGAGICCVGKKLPDIKELRELRADATLPSDLDNTTDMWSYPSIMKIASNVLKHNVSTDVVEQAIVFAITALDISQYYHEYSDKIGADLSRVTGLKWFTIVGQKDTYDISLTQFTSYIIIAINELEIIMFTTDEGNSPAPAIPHYRPPAPPPRVQAMAEIVRDDDQGLDSRPIVNILRNEMNETLRQFIVQTIDYVLNSCANDGYHCVAYKLDQALNQQYASADGVGDRTHPDYWQCIITSNTFATQTVVDVDHLSGFLLDVIFNNRHRIVVYKTRDENQISTEESVLKSARKALSMNASIILDKKLISKHNTNYSKTTIEKALLDINGAVLAAHNFWAVCNDMTRSRYKYFYGWGCIAGAQHMFAGDISKTRDNNYLVIKLDQLVVILFGDKLNI